MKISAEDLRRQYADLSDEALLEVDRQDLVELARNCYDEELARRNLKATSARPDDPDEFVVAATFASQEEAKAAGGLMVRDGIRAKLGVGGLTLLVPASLLEDARDLLEAQIPEEATGRGSRQCQLRPPRRGNGSSLSLRQSGSGRFRSGSLRRSRTGANAVQSDFVPH